MKTGPTLIENAVRIAVKAHEGQVRKNDASPYVVHPFMCAMKLARYGLPEEVIAGALVHDVLEDTEMTRDDLENVLGSEVVEIVTHVTEDKTLPWEERKAEYVELVRDAPDEVKLVSLVDKIHNMESVIYAHSEMGSSLWEKFNRGKEKKLWFEELCLSMFKETLKHPLVDEYKALVEQMKTLD